MGRTPCSVLSVLVLQWLRHFLVAVNGALIFPWKIQPGGGMNSIAKAWLAGNHSKWKKKPISSLTHCWKKYQECSSQTEPWRKENVCMTFLRQSECLLFAACPYRWVNGRMVPCPWSTMCGLAMNYMEGQQPGRMTTCPLWHWRRLRSSLLRTWIHWAGRAWGTPSPVGNRSKHCETQSTDVPNQCQNLV